jgi:hypothetical protein
MHFGWDFAPRLRAMGIWDNARLVVCSGVYVRDVQVQAEPLALPADPTPTALRLRLDVDSDAAHPITAHVTVRPVTGHDADGWQFEFPLHLAVGRSEHALAFELPAARLWQPWERGEAVFVSADLRIALHHAVPRSKIGQSGYWVFAHRPAA